jgi:hypothetical protein
VLDADPPKSLDIAIQNQVQIDGEYTSQTRALSVLRLPPALGPLVSNATNYDDPQMTRPDQLPGMSRFAATAAIQRATQDSAAVAGAVRR